MSKGGNPDSLIFGVATNDLREHITKWKDKDGITHRCPFYIKWHSMVRRCYSKVNLVNNPAYIGCSVDRDWLTFSNFKSWMEGQDWVGKELDKDIYGNGKFYSPTTCIFVSKRLNNFLTRIYSCNGGADFHVKTGKWRARCSNPMTNKNEHLGLFSNENGAIGAWMTRKCQLAEELLSETKELHLLDNVLNVIQRSR